MDNMDEHSSFSRDLEGISMMNNIIKCGKKEARLELMQNFLMAAQVKQEFSPDAPAINGLRPLVEFDDTEMWLDRAHVDTFILILPKTWDVMLLKS